AAGTRRGPLPLVVTPFPDRRERATAIGIWSAVTGLSVAIGPVSGGLLLEHFAWGSVFLVNLPLATIAVGGGRLLSEPVAGGWVSVVTLPLATIGVVAGRLLLAESRSARRSRFDLVGAA